MAPMAGLTDAGVPAQRAPLGRRPGPHRDDRRAWASCTTTGARSTTCACGEDEHPIGFQLFGADADALARAAAVCVEAGADLIDLNMACPVRKVVKTGAGAALLGAPDAAEAAVRAVVAAVRASVPVTVKIRSGLREGDEAGRRLAPRLVAAGAAAVCIHPRTAAQLYRGRADHARDGGPGGRAARPRDRLRRRGRPRGRPRPARARRGRRDAGPPRPRPALALPRDPRGRAAAGPRPSGSRKCSASPMRCSPEMGPSRRRSPAPVLAAVPAQRRPRPRPRRRSDGGAAGTRDPGSSAQPRRSATASRG